MGAHALGAAAYAIKAVGLAAPDRPEAAEDELRWQLTHMSTEVRTALRALPPVGQNRSGPLGPGLLSSGQLGRIVRDLQAGVTLPDQDDQWSDNDTVALRATMSISDHPGRGEQHRPEGRR